MGKTVRIVLLPVVLLGAIFAIACSGSSEEKGVTIEVRAENTRFVPDVIQVPVGQTVTLRLTNLDPNEHDLEVRGLRPASIEGGGHAGHGDSASVRPVAVHAAAKKAASVKFRVDQPGTYDVLCTIPGHEQSGMVARLVVS